jgi:hypothetical protein
MEQLRFLMIDMHTDRSMQPGLVWINDGAC